jgi:hypothetical protein
LADGLSVKTVSSTWNNMTNTKFGMLVAQARAKSPGWARAMASATVSQHRRTSSVKRGAAPSAQPQVIDRAARVRDRIHRSQVRASSRDHSTRESQ